MNEFQASLSIYQQYNVCVQKNVPGWGWVNTGWANLGYKSSPACPATDPTVKEKQVVSST